MVEQEARSDPEHTEHKRVLGMLYIWKAEVLAASGNLDSALSEYRKTADIFSGFVSKEPKDIQARVVLAATRVKIGDVLTMKNNLAAASETYQQAISGAESLALSAPANHQAQYVVADAYSGMFKINPGPESLYAHLLRVRRARTGVWPTSKRTSSNLWSRNGQKPLE